MRGDAADNPDQRHRQSTELMDKRITELEIRLTHNEHTLDILNQTIIEQHKLIDRLQLQVSILEKKLKAATEASPVAHENEETPPPHY